MNTAGKRKLHSARMTIPQWKMVPTEGPGGSSSGRKSVPNGTKAAQVELWIDIDSLFADLAPQALRNKSGQSSMGSGAIVAVVVGPVSREGAT